MLPLASLTASQTACARKGMKPQRHALRGSSAASSPATAQSAGRPKMK